MDALYVTAEEMRKHLNIDFDEDDEYLDDLVASAQDACATYLQRPLSELVVDGRLRPQIRHAVKMMAGHFYANREAVAFASPSEVPFGIAFLLTPFKKFQ